MKYLYSFVFGLILSFCFYYIDSKILISKYFKNLYLPYDDDRFQITINDKDSYNIIYNGYDRGAPLNIQHIDEVFTAFYASCSNIFSKYNSDIKEIYINIQPPLDFDRKIDRFALYGWKFQVRIAVDIKKDFKLINKKQLHKSKNGKEQLWFSYYIGASKYISGISPIYKENADICKFQYNDKLGDFKQKIIPIDMPKLKKLNNSLSGIFYEYTNKKYNPNNIF